MTHSSARAKARSMLHQVLTSQGKARAFLQHPRTATEELARLAQKQLNAWTPLHERTTPSDSPFQVIDFFSGCGGMSLGFAALSLVSPFFQLVGGCDIDPDAAATYQRNFGVPVPTTDVASLDADASALREFLRDLPQYDEHKPLVAIGCAPCQGFTAHRKKDWNRKDKRNTLVGTFASVAVQLNPACVIMENVPEMLSRKYWAHFQEARNILRQHGYTVHQTIYNSASFGVPQERFRAIVLAMKQDFLLPDPLMDPEDYVTVRQAIGHLPSVAPGQSPPDDPMHRSANHRRTTIDTIRAVPKDGGSRPPGVGPECLDRVDGYYDVYGRLHWDKPAITITHYARNPASGRFVHPQQDRGLTMREVALLQSFPRGFEFVGSFDSVFKQIGEAVPPKMACALAASVLVEMVTSPPTEIEKQAATAPILEPVSNSFSSVIAGLKKNRSD